MDEILNESEAEYYMNFREFIDGTVEAVVKVIRPLTGEVIRNSVNELSYSAECRARGESSSVSSCTYVRSPEEISDYEKQKNHQRAVRRAKQHIRWLAKQMRADRLFTLSYRRNEQDRETVKKDFARFLRLVRGGWKGREGQPDWQYVAVLEKQDRGAYHIHCAVQGWQKIKFLREAWYKALGGQGNEVGIETPGQVDVTNPDKKRWGHTGREWKTKKLAGYLTKYLEKTFDNESSERKRYWHSKGLDVPPVQRMLLNSNCIVHAIQECVNHLRFICDLRSGFDMWLSSFEDCFWLSGSCRGAG